MAENTMQVEKLPKGGYMEICIYCGKEEAASSEHILQDSLGADWERKSILCGACNNLFGRTIDKALANEFVFFRNFLSIRGKRGDVPTLHMENENGEKIKRDGTTGDITTLAKPQIAKHDTGDGTYTISVNAEVAKTDKIYEDILKGLKRKGLKIGATSTNKYAAQPVWNDAGRADFTLPTYIALRKSLLNYWCYLRRDQEIAEIESEAKKIHVFAKFCDANQSTEERDKLAANLGIDGFPLSIDISSTAKEIMRGQSTIFDSIFLVPIDKELYGGVCLFNEIQWGFKISNNTSMNNNPIITTVDIMKRKIDTKQGDFQKISNSDFKFLQLDYKKRLENTQEYFSNAIQICAAMEHYTSIKNIVEPGYLEKYFPITNRDVIQGIFSERAAMVLGWEFAPLGVKPDFFKSEVGDVFVQAVVSSFFEHMEPNFTLTSEAYAHFIGGSFKIAQSLSKQLPVIAQFAK
jgi:hypothetical protein